MAPGTSGAIIRQLRTLFEMGTLGDLTDGQLLERFATSRGETADQAFAVLVERHGPMVLRVCRGVLADTHDTQDAFQATFLVLVRKARGLWVRDSLGPWLHQVAFRTASCARASAARRRRHEQAAGETVLENRTVVERIDEDVRWLHEEINRLPERFRAPIVLCDLEGNTHEQAARHLGWPIGTVKSRQARGRQRLRDRLLRRGLTMDQGMLAPCLHLASELPDAMVNSTTSAAVQTVTAGTIVQGASAILAQRVIMAMLITKCLKVAAVALALGALGTGVELAAQQRQAPADAATETETGGLKVVAAQPGTQAYEVRGRGVVEPAHEEIAICKVKGRTTILAILPEGTRVKKGQLVCTLDSSSVQDSLKNQKIATAGAEAAYQQARFAREVAETVLKEHEEGIVMPQQTILQTEIALVNEIIEKLRDTRKEPDAEMIKRERASLEKLQQNLIVTKLLMERTRKKLAGDVEKARSDEQAKKAVCETERSKEDQLSRELENCRIYAPTDGIIIHANDPHRVPNRAPTIAEGSTVRERQIIFKVHDPDGPMQINAKITEATVHWVKPGLPARIQIDAFVGETLKGVVSEVAPLPDPNRLFDSGAKFYTTWIRIETNRKNLLSGMTAQATIDRESPGNTLSVPCEAVLTFDGKDHVAIKQTDGSIEWHEVVLGTRNETDVEVKQGLQKGELVVLHPIELLTPEERRARKLDDPARPATPR